MRAPGSVLFLLVLLAARPGGAADPCGEGLFVPDGYALLCETRVEGGRRSGRVVVRPGGGAAAGLGAAVLGMAGPGELTLRRLDEAEEPLAWQVPELWLTERVTVGLGGLAARLRAAAGGAGPPAHPAARAAADGLAGALAGLGQLPRRACAAEHRPGRHQLRCGWGVPPLGVEVRLRLVEAGATGTRSATGRSTSGGCATSRRSPTPSRPAGGSGAGPAGRRSGAGGHGTLVGIP
jgi:hypothetical protein